MNSNRRSNVNLRAGRYERRLWRGIATVGLSLLGVACNKAEPLKRTAVQAAPVSVQLVERQDVLVEVNAIGTVEAVSTVDVVAQVSGRIMRVEFEEGAFVKRDAPLFTIDTRPYNASLSAAQAELQRSEAQAEQAKLEAQRYSILVREGLATAQEAALRNTEMKESQAAVQADRAQLESANLNLQFSTIRSPIDGRTGRLLVHAGNIVQPNDKPMVVIRSLAPVKVNFTISQDLLPALRQRYKSGSLRVRATPRGKGAKTAIGELSFVDNTVDSATGALTLKATFPNLDEELWPGSFVDVVLELGVDSGAIVAPEAAIAEGQHGTYAFVVDEQSIAHMTLVTIGRRTETQAIIERGLSPGQRVVTDGRVRLKDGIAVDTKPTSTLSEVGTHGEPIP